MIKISRIYFDFEEEANGVSHLPVVTWVEESDHFHCKQTAFQLQIAETDTFETIIYDTKWKKTTQSRFEDNNLVLKEFARYYLRIRFHDNQGNTSIYTHTTFTTGFITHHIAAQMITVEKEEDAKSSKGTYLRKTFTLAKSVKEAYLVATSFGLYQATINGKRVGKGELTPGWTSYHKNLLLQQYDITPFLDQGKNTLGIILGAGWYKGDMSFTRTRNIYGNRTGFLGEIHLTYGDGSQGVIPSDTSFKGSDSPIEFSEIYDGEVYNEAKEQEGWNCNDFDDDAWEQTTSIPYSPHIVTRQKGKSVEIIEERKPLKIFQTPQGDQVIDFGQNESGWIRIQAAGKKGDVIELNCFEIVDAKGNVYTENLRTAKQRIRYTFDKTHAINYLPHFTFFGFRYAKITSFPGIPQKENFSVCVLHTKMEETGTIETSNQLINQLNHNIVWGLKSNFVDIPSDCPQRDERLGWTGDAQIFSNTASFLMNTYQFYAKWLTDLAFDQRTDGAVPHVIPDIITGRTGTDRLLKQGTAAAAAWADAAVIIPWNLSLVFGSKDILIQQYESMKKWIHFMQTHSKNNIWNYQLQFGDWVALDAEKGSYFGATPNDLTCTAYYAYSTSLFVKIAHLLHKTADEKTYTQLYQKIVSTYVQTFFTEDGHMKVHTQTAHIISLYFHLVPQKYRSVVTADLVDLLEKEKNHLVTGFVGTPYFCHALSDNGRVDKAYDLLLQEDFPSWLYQVKKGATTIWEHWDGMKDDGSLWSADMNSFNHYAYGAIGEWMQQVMVGLQIDEENPGYQHFFLKPLVTNRIAWVSGTYRSIHGTIESRWEHKKGKHYQLTVHIPVNTSCTIKLQQAQEIEENNGITFVKHHDIYEASLDSGTYSCIFTIA